MIIHFLGSLSEILIVPHANIKLKNHDLKPRVPSSKEHATMLRIEVIPQVESCVFISVSTDSSIQLGLLLKLWLIVDNKFEPQRCYVSTFNAIIFTNSVSLS